MKNTLIPRFSQELGFNPSPLAQSENSHIKYSKGKGKAIPLQAWTGPDGSRRLRFPDFKTIGT